MGKRRKPLNPHQVATTYKGLALEEEPPTKVERMTKEHMLAIEAATTHNALLKRLAVRMLKRLPREQVKRLAQSLQRGIRNPD